MTTSTISPAPSRSSRRTSPGRLLRRLRRSERGVLDIELVLFVPLLVIITLFLIQGFLAVSTVTSVSAAARDGARAAMLGRSATAAAEKSLPDWVALESVTDGEVTLTFTYGNASGPIQTSEISCTISKGWVTVNE